MVKVEFNCNCCDAKAYGYVSRLKRGAMISVARNMAWDVEYSDDGGYELCPACVVRRDKELREGNNG